MLGRKGWYSNDGVFIEGLLCPSLHHACCHEASITLISTPALQPYALHATFQFAGTPGKKHRMREFMLFDDPPEYYDHSVGFITFSVSGRE